MTAAPDRPGLLRRWLIFTNERYSFAEHVPFIFCLALGNAVVACRLTATPFSPRTFALGALVYLLFFFRLRCFDEVKDYDTDLRVNPTRPLARGLLTVGDVKTMFVAVTVLEFVLVWLASPAALGAHAVAVAYSYLMYKEFFIGKQLAPHLTTYGLTHTVVSTLLAYSVFAQMTGLPLTRLPVPLLVFGLSSWAIFNLFEFARKTFAPDEERPGVPSYTTRFGIPGAALLSLSQVAAAVALVAYLAGRGEVFSGRDVAVQAGVAAFPLLAALDFARRPARPSAKRFRTVCALYLIVFFALLSFQGWF